MSETQQIDDLSQQILKHGLMLAEATDEMVQNHSGEAVEQSMIDTATTMLENTKDPKREQKIIMLLVNIGNRLGSDSVQQFGKQKYQEWQQKHGG